MALLAAPLFAALLLAATWASAQAQIQFLEEDPGTKVPITLLASLAPAKVRPGEFARVQVEVELGAPWYIYALRPDPGGGPPTRMTLEKGVLVGTGRFAESPPEEQLDMATGGSVRVHKARALFWTDVHIPAQAQPGPLAIAGSLAYAACNGKICLPLRREAFVATGSIEPGPSRQDTRRIIPGR